MLRIIPRLALAFAGLAVSCTALQAEEDETPNWFARAFTLSERGWSVNAEAHRPRDAYGRINRDIAVYTLNLERRWSFRYGTEFGANGGLFVADGTRNEPGYAAPRDSDSIGVNLGGSARQYLFAWHGIRPFAEGYINVLYTPGHPFPVGGSGVNGFLRVGGGIRIDLTDAYAIETGYHLSHISNGGGLEPSNPAYNGESLFLNLRARW